MGVVVLTDATAALRERRRRNARAPLFAALLLLGCEPQNDEGYRGEPLLAFSVRLPDKRQRPADEPPQELALVVVWQPALPGGRDTPLLAERTFVAQQLLSVARVHLYQPPPGAHIRAEDGWAIGRLLVVPREALGRSGGRWSALEPHVLTTSPAHELRYLAAPSAAPRPGRPDLVSPGFFWCTGAQEPEPLSEAHCAALEEGQVEMAIVPAAEVGPGESKPPGEAP